MHSIFRKTINLLFYIIAAFYLFMMIDLFFRFSYILDTDRVISRSYNLIPFKTIWAYLRGADSVSRSSAITNTVGNMLVFIPYGLYVQVVRKHKGFGKCLLIVMITSVAIELVQFAFGLGACDIDDVLLNSCGGAIGMMAYGLFQKVCKGESRTKTAITLLSIIIGVPVIYLYFTTVFNHLRL